MDHVADQGLPTEAMVVRPADRRGAAFDRRVEPSAARVGAVFAGTAAMLAVLVGLARLLAPIAATAGGLVASIATAVAATLLAASIVEWVVHRWIMHRPSRLPLLRLAYEHHHRAHHWINFPPDQYIQAGPVQYVPLWNARLDRAATGRLAWGVTIAAHFAFYGLFAIALVVLPAWVLSGNTAFAWSVTVTSVVVLFLFIHAHDAMHYPGLSPVERLRSFKWLDHHHYIHHIDTDANTNFLLPLGDLLFGTLRRELSLEELRRWPSYEEARRTLVTPEFAADGTRLQGSVQSS